LGTVILEARLKSGLNGKEVHVPKGKDNRDPDVLLQMRSGESCLLKYKPEDTGRRFMPSDQIYSFWGTSGDIS
jgi:hypothetical protein